MHIENENSREENEDLRESCLKTMNELKSKLKELQSLLTVTALPETNFDEMIGDRPFHAAVQRMSCWWNSLVAGWPEQVVAKFLSIVASGDDLSKLPIEENLIGNKVEEMLGKLLARYNASERRDLVFLRRHLTVFAPGTFHQAVCTRCARKLDFKGSAFEGFSQLQKNIIENTYAEADAIKHCIDVKLDPHMAEDEMKAASERIHGAAAHIEKLREFQALHIRIMGRPDDGLLKAISTGSHVYNGMLKLIDRYWEVRGLKRK